MITNKLYYGDNLSILRDYIKDESVDLIYLDPPFNSKTNYNILYKELTGEQSQAQITAFEDTWHWTEESERTFQEIIDTAPPMLVDMMVAFRKFVGINDVMAYLTMMAIRLIELHRVLKNTGSIYLHCDPTASHYLKILMDTIFGKKNVRNEIVWHYTGRRMKASQKYNSKHDIIFYYAKSDKTIIKNYPVEGWNRDEYIKMKKQEVHKDEDGREWIWGHAGKQYPKLQIKTIDELLKDDRLDLPTMHISHKKAQPSDKSEQIKLEI